MFRLKVTLNFATSGASIPTGSIAAYKTLYGLILGLSTNQSEYDAVFGAGNVVVEAYGTKPTATKSTLSSVDYFEYPSTGIKAAMFTSGTGFVNTNYLGITAIKQSQTDYVKYQLNTDLKATLTDGYIRLPHTVMPNRTIHLIIDDKFLLVAGVALDGSSVSSQLFLPVSDRVMMLSLIDETDIAFGDSAPISNSKFITLFTNYGPVLSTVNTEILKYNRGSNWNTVVCIPPMINLRTSPVKPAFQFKSQVYGGPVVDHSAETGLLLTSHGKPEEVLDTTVVNNGTTYNLFGHFLLPA